MTSEDLIEVLGNKYNTEILSATTDPKSAQDLSDELDVPIATCYRRINELTETNLLELHDRPPPIPVAPSPPIIEKPLALLWTVIPPLPISIGKMSVSMFCFRILATQ